MIPRMSIALLCLIAFAAGAAAPASATAPPTSRPTFGEAREVVHQILDAYAAGTDGKLVLGGCRHHGNLWIVCRARIDRRHDGARYRFTISSTAYTYIIRTEVTPRRR